MQRNAANLSFEKKLIFIERNSGEVCQPGTGNMRHGKPRNCPNLSARRYATGTRARSAHRESHSTVGDSGSCGEKLRKCAKETTPSRNVSEKR